MMASLEEMEKNLPTMDYKDQTGFESKWKVVSDESDRLSKRILYGIIILLSEGLNRRPPGSSSLL